MQYIAHWPQTPAGKNICHTCSTIEPCIVNVLFNHSFASAVTWRRQLCVMWPVRPWLIKYDSPNHLNTHSDWSGSGLTLMSMIGPVGDISVCDKSVQTILNCLHNREFMGMFACVYLLRNRIRQYPALVNCMTIDWFSEWPRDALLEVAERFLHGLSLGSEDGVRHINRKMLQWLFYKCCQCITHKSTKVY